MPNEGTQKINPRFHESDAKEDYDPFLAFEKKVLKQGGTGDLNRISRQYENTENFEDLSKPNTPKKNTLDIGANPNKMRESKSKFRIKRANSLCDTDEKNQEFIDNSKQVNPYEKVNIEFQDQSFNNTGKEDQFNITFRNLECTSDLNSINGPFKNTLAQTDTNLNCTINRTQTLDLSKPSLHINKKNKINVYNHVNFDHLENPISNKEKSNEINRSNKKNLKIASNIEFTKGERSAKTPNIGFMDKEKLAPISKNHQLKELNERLKLKSNLSPVGNDIKPGAFIKNNNLSYKHLNLDRSNQNSASKHFLNRDIVDRNLMNNNT